MRYCAPCVRRFIWMDDGAVAAHQSVIVTIHFTCSELCVCVHFAVLRFRVSEPLATYSRGLVARVRARTHLNSLAKITFHFQFYCVYMCL